MGRSGRGSAGVFSPGPGHERRPEKGTGVCLPITARLSPSALSNHSRPFKPEAVPPISARSVAARRLRLAPLARTPEAPLPPPPLWEPAEQRPRCRCLGRRCCGREGRPGASSSGPGRDQVLVQGSGQAAGSGRTRPQQWRRREQRLRGPRGVADPSAAGIGGLGLVEPAGAASGCDWLAVRPWGINSGRWGGSAVSSAVKLGATGAVDARSEERRCGRTGPPRQLIRGAPPQGAVRSMSSF
ncbi:uncharacterized protein LOC131090874 [Melospiza georgiana]|uniref:uncharacterized protein LOC131090874 n=1 Tax=Melospiza georgiana TaxID=44398 RepID=UPI0025AC9FA9|nr:uncharacterized protein LOC131090874 [Melospiza georgiana]